MMASHRFLLLVAVFLAVPYVVLGTLAWTMFGTGMGLSVGLGIGIVIIMALGVWAIGAGMRFGFQVQGLARRLDAEGLLPDLSELPRRPSGRIEPAAADAWFDDRKAELDAEPTDWRRWYVVSVAYDIAGDRSRARDSMRQAIRLSGRAEFSVRSGDGSPATSA